MVVGGVDVGDCWGEDGGVIVGLINNVWVNRE